MNFKHIYIPSNKTNSPTLLVFHGMGGNEKSLVNFAKSVAPEANILSVRGNIIEKGMTRFYKSGFDAKDIKKRTSDIAGFIKNIGVKYNFDKRNIYALGWSNGANMAAFLILYKPLLLKGAILLRTLILPLPTPPPNLNKVSIFISGATDDLVDAPQDSKKLAEILKSLHANVTFHWHKGGHDLSKDDEIVVNNWWHKNLRM